MFPTSRLQEICMRVHVRRTYEKHEIRYEVIYLLVLERQGLIIARSIQIHTPERPQRQRRGMSLFHLGLVDGAVLYGILIYF